MSIITRIDSNIEKAIASEAVMISEFFNKNLDSNFPYFNTEAKSSYRPLFEPNHLSRKIIKGRELIYTAKTEGKLSGLLFGGGTEGGVGTIIWLLVDKDYQSLGIGSQLLKKSIAVYQTLGAHKIKLTVHDERALKFYQKEGFKIEGRHPNHWFNLHFYSVARSI